MMKRETLNEYKRVVRKFGHYASQQLEQTLIDSHLEALDRIEELERQINGEVPNQRNPDIR
jgi:hypothetical protein